MAHFRIHQRDSRRIETIQRERRAARALKSPTVKHETQPREAPQRAARTRDAGAVAPPSTDAPRPAHQHAGAVTVRANTGTFRESLATKLIGAIIAIKGTDDSLRSEEAARDLVEKARWPNGPICPKCAAPEFSPLSSRPGVRTCRRCRYQYTATVGTEFHRHKIGHAGILALSRAFAESRSVTAKGVQQLLGVTYVTAWKVYDRLYLPAGYSSKADGRTGASATRVRPLEFLYPYACEKSADPALNLILKVNAAVPHELPEQFRPDVCQSLLVAVIAGEIDLEELANRQVIRSFISREYRAFLTISRSFVSLDAPAFRDSDRSIGESLAADGKLIR